MKYDLKTTLLMISLFTFAQITGLFIINRNFQVYGVEMFKADEEASASTAYNIPLMILFISFVFILIYKLRFQKLLIFWYAFAFLSTVTVSLSSFVNEFYALFVAFGLMLLRLSNKDDYFHNMTELLVYGGIAVIILPLLDVFSAVTLLIIISVYDYIAVMLSKHMITLAKTQFELNIFSGLKIQRREFGAVLGGGDIAFPLIFAGVLLRDSGLLPAILVVYGSIIGLTALILLGKENKFYPAMPFISAGCFLGLIIHSLALL